MTATRARRLRADLLAWPLVCAVAVLAVLCCFVARAAHPVETLWRVASLAEINNFRPGWSHREHVRTRPRRRG